MAADEQRRLRFAFGPAIDEQDVSNVARTYLSAARIQEATDRQATHLAENRGILNIETPDPALDHFVNHWLGRQILFHGDLNRLTTDPQTRNYLQDHMGMVYLRPSVSRRAFKFALSQQEASGALPDGILLNTNAALKYINQIPHTDHNVWLPICLQAFLAETNDYDLLHELCGFANSDEQASVYAHVDRALRWLLQNRDHRGLLYIGQGDWCDPMNMAGHKGRGVSGWLTFAAAYACQVWADICGKIDKPQAAKEFADASAQLNTAANQHLWFDAWYARGITDDDVPFGVPTDIEGRIFLNAQSWAMLSGAADASRQATLIRAVEDNLETPYGVAVLAPAFTTMREDIGRLTQKYPGTAENGSIYNHAAAFYIFALFNAGHGESAYRLLKKMIPGSDETDLLQRGQLPVFIPNYYRGASHSTMSGRSSQLINTGTIHWIYRSLTEQLFGLAGHPKGLIINPQLPKSWSTARVSRRFRNATIDVRYTRSSDRKTRIEVDGQPLD
ncbi:MAG: NdvB protein, partial [Myxococcota bacterium]